MHFSMEDIIQDLTFLGIQNINIDDLTIADAKTAYHKLAKQIHPDKTDRNDVEKYEKNTEAFKKAGNCYERILKYIVEKLQAKRDNGDIIITNDQVFAKDNFGKFNFPFENQGSFTVLVQDTLAEAWEQSLAAVYGEPSLKHNM